MRKHVAAHGRLAIEALLLCGFAIAPASASDRQIPMADYIQDIWEGRDGGLPHPTVTALQQTRDGYLWVGTYSGLTRFDGLAFRRPVPGEHGVYRDHVRGLAESADGSLWVGTRRNGLVRIKDGALRAFTTADGLKSNDVTSLAVTPGGTVWMAAGALTSVMPNGDVRQYGAEAGLAIPQVFALFADRDGTLWIGGQRGALAWHDGREFQTVSPWGAGTETLTVSAITRDHEGRLWVGTAGGLFRLEGERTAAVTSVRHLPDSVTSFSTDDRGLWVGTANDGIVRLEGGVDKRYSTADRLLHEWAFAMHRDAQGNLWVGTRTGLIQLRPRIMQNYTQHDGLPAAHTVCVLESRNGDLWVGTFSGLARRREQKWTTFGVKDGLPSASTKALAEGSDGAIWIGTGDGVARYKDGRFTAYRGEESPYNTRAVALDVDGSGSVWIGTNQGLDRLENGVVTRILPRAKLCGSYSSAGEATINWLAPATDGTLWVGGASALMHVRGQAVDCLGDAAASPSDVRNILRKDVRYISAEPDGPLWVGSIGGLARVAAGKVEALDGPRAPFNTGNYAVVDDGRGSIWCSTTKGLFEVRKEDLARDGGRARARAFGLGDGLATTVFTGSGQPSGWRGSDGRLYFTSADGLAVVDPERVPASATAPPPVYIESMLADGRTLAPGGVPRLAPGTREVEFHFAAVDFSAPETVRYRYRLDGLDTDWRDSTSGRIANYTNLRPARYRFRVMASDRNGVWHEPGASLAFDLQPRFHQTFWFRLLAVAALAAAALVAHRIRLAREHVRAAQLQRKVDEAVASINVLRGLLPICSGCHRVRQDSGYWQQIETYVMERSDARFSHSICAECYAKLKAEDPNLPDMKLL